MNDPEQPKVDVWRLSALVASRCDDSERLRACWPRPRLRRAVCRFAVLLELTAGLGVAGEGGHAVLCLTPPRRVGTARLVAVVGAVALATAVALGTVMVLWWPLGLAALASWALVLVPALRSAWRWRGVDRRLRASRPEGGWHLHNFAGDSRYRGAGAQLLWAVCAEADRRGRTLYLDTSVRQLIDYYRGFGFETAAEEAMAARGETWAVFRMVRLPAQAPAPSTSAMERAGRRGRTAGSPEPAS